MRRYDVFSFLAGVTDEEIAEALEKRALVRELRIDGHTQEEIARRVGVTLNAVKRMCPGTVGYMVPVAPLREAFLATSYTAADVARSLGWWTKKGGSADVGRVRRTLGISPDRGHFRTMTDAENVRLIAEAIGISPWALLPEDETVCAPAAIPSGAPVMVAA